MCHFNINIANTVIEIETVHVLPYALSRKFLTNDECDFKVKSTQKDIDEAAAKFYDDNGFRLLWDGNIETMVVLRKVAEGLIDHDTFAMHGAAIAVNNNGFLFTADSGVGKTTHILKWLNKITESFVVNGDKPFIHVGDMPLVCGSPWAGKENLYTNTTVPLKAIIIMERNANNIIRKISFAEAFPYLYKQSHRPKDTEKLKRTINLIKSLDNKVSFYHFLFNNYKEDCLDVAYRALTLNDYES